MRFSENHKKTFFVLRFCSALLIATILSVNHSATAQICSDFDDQTVQGWTGIAIQTPSTSQPGPSGSGSDYYLRVVDASGGSSINSPDSYHGDWTMLSTTGCAVFKYDIRLFHDGNPNGSDNRAPNFLIEGGGFRAVFRVGFDINEDGGPFAGWHRVEAPISPLVNGVPPSNSFGFWEVLSPGTNADWNTLIMNVDRVYFPVDINSNPAEIWGYDNICLEPDECPVECTFESDNILCELDDMGFPTGDFLVTGTLTNLQDTPGTHIFLPPTETSPDGVEVCFGNGMQVLAIDPPIGLGESFEVGQDTSPLNSDSIAIKNAMPGDEVCFVMVVRGENGIECCRVDVCFQMPPCDCLQIDRRFDEIVIEDIDDILCASGTVSFNYTFQLTNLFGQDVYHAFLTQPTTGRISPDYFDLAALNGGPLQQGQSVLLTIRVENVPPEQLVEFIVNIHNQDLTECCSREHNVMSVACLENVSATPGDINQDGVVDLLDVGPFVGLLTSGEYLEEADINQDGLVNLTDVGPFVDLLTGT